MAGVEHTNVVRLYELFCEDDPWFFTMEIVQGVDLVRYVRGGGGPASNAITLPSGFEPVEDEGYIRSRPHFLQNVSAVLVQLVHGLQAIHAAGKLHCDIKPSNVVVSPEGRLVILDFGLVTETNAARRVATSGSQAPLAISRRNDLPDIGPRKPVTGTRWVWSCMSPSRADCQARRVRERGSCRCRWSTAP